MLGVRFGNNGSTSPCIASKKKKLMKLAWKSAPQARKSSCAWRRKEKFLEMMCGGLLRAHWHTWIPSAALAKTIDRWQRRIWSMASNLQRREGED